MCTAALHVQSAIMTSHEQLNVNNTYTVQKHHCYRRNYSYSSKSAVCLASKIQTSLDKNCPRFPAHMA